MPAAESVDGVPDGAGCGAVDRSVRGLVRRNAWLIAIAGIYLYIFPYFPRLHSANELPRAYLVKAMVHHQTFAIDEAVASWGTTLDVSESGGHMYSNKAPGSSMLAVPVYAAVNAIAGEPSLAATIWLCRVTTGILPMLLFLVLLHRFLARFAPDPAIRTLVVVAYALGSMAMPYSVLYFSHQLASVCIATAWILSVEVVDGQRGLRAMAAAGALAGAAPLVDYQAVFAAIPVGIYVIVRWRRDPRLGRAAAYAVGGAALPIAILLAYHQACFDSPWRTGYHASTAFAMYHQHGFLGITQLRWDAFAGSLLSFDDGLLMLSPWLLIGVSGAVELWRSPDRGLAVVCVAVACIYVVFISSINFWRGGGAVGPRYITAVLPFLLPLVATQMHAMRNRPDLLGALSGAIVLAVGIYTLTSATFPYWPDVVKNPFRDVTLRLLGDHLAAPNLGSALGLPRVVGLIPYVALVAWTTGHAIQRVVHRRGLWISCGVAFALLIAYLLVPAGLPNDGYVYVRGVVSP